MKSNEIRRLARESLQNSWKKAAILTAIYFLVSFILGTIAEFIPTIGKIISIIISPVLSFGILVSFIKLSRNEEIQYLDFLKNGFNLFKKIWGILFYSFLTYLPAILLLIVSSILNMWITFGNNDLSYLSPVFYILNIISIVWLIVKAYSLYLTSFILNDEPTLNSSEIVNKSKTLMKGNIVKLFLLEFSFIGWLIVSTLTIGIATLWVFPYIQISLFKFYEEIKSSQYSDLS